MTFIKFVYVEQPCCKPFPVGKGNTWQIKIDPGKSGSNFNLLFVVFSHSKRILRSQNMMKVLINDVAKILKIFLLIDKIPIKADDKNDDKLLELYFLGNPLFDDEGRVFYQNSL
jgi:hypothetical protein